jgi:hypothetical protein
MGTVPELIEPLERQKPGRGAIGLSVDQVGVIRERCALIDGWAADLDFALARGRAGIMVDACRLLVAPPLRLPLLGERVVCAIGRAVLRLDRRNTAFWGDLLFDHRTEPTSS